MEKRPVADGAWIEIEAADVLKRREEIGQAKIVVLKSLRLEIDGGEAAKLSDRMAEIARACEDELVGMDEGQKAFFLFRRLLVG